MPTILALDATTEACSAALQTDRGCWARLEPTARGHSRMLLQMIQAVVEDASVRLSDVEAIGVCRGPGSFTGVRIAIGVAQGLSAARRLSVAPVSTLACIAQRAHRLHGSERIAAAIDARMNEVYSGHFELDAGGLMRPVGDEAVSPPAAVDAPGHGAGSWHGVGTGWAAHREALTERYPGGVERVFDDLLPAAEDVLPLARALIAEGATVSAAQVRPTYLRDRVTG